MIPSWMWFRSTGGHWALGFTTATWLPSFSRTGWQKSWVNNVSSVKRKLGLFNESHWWVSPICNSRHRELGYESLWCCPTSLLKQLYVLAWPHCSDILKGVDGISGLSVVLLLRAVSQPPERSTAVVAWARFIAFPCLRNVGRKGFGGGREERAFAWLGFCLVMRNSWSLFERAWLQQACAHGNDWHLHPGQVLGSFR